MQCGSLSYRGECRDIGSVSYFNSPEIARRFSFDRVNVSKNRQSLPSPFLFFFFFFLFSTIASSSCDWSIRRLPIILPRYRDDCQNMVTLAFPSRHYFDLARSPGPPRPRRRLRRPPLAALCILSSSVLRSSCTTFCCLLVFGDIFCVRNIFFLSRFGI